MQRLLSDAEKISGIHYDIENYADVVEAIHVIQDEMDITGTTMLEGSATISGSLNQLNAAWENFLTAIGDGGETMDMSVVTQNLVNSLVAAAKNVVPAIARIAMTVVSTLPSAFAEAIGVIIPQIQEAITAEFGETGGEMFAGFVDSAAAIGDKLKFVVAGIEGIIEQAMPIIQQAIVPTLTFIGSIINTAANIAVEAVANVVGIVNSTLMPAITEIAGIVGPVIMDIMNVIMDVMPTIQGIFSSVWSAITKIVKTAVSAIMGAIRGIQSVVSTVTGIFNGIKNAITKPIETAKNTIRNIINTIKGFFSGFHISLPHIKLPHFVISPSGWQIGDLLKGSIPSLNIRWYGSGGYVEDPTLIGAGERGGELIWPSYEPYLSQYADALASRIGGGTTNVYLNDVSVNDSEGVREITAEYLVGLKRLAAI